MENIDLTEEKSSLMHIDCSEDDMITGQKRQRDDSFIYSEEPSTKRVKI